jgi:regulator of cell morphogenesis and NO signaling
MTPHAETAFAGPLHLAAANGRLVEAGELPDEALVARLADHHARVRRALPYLVALLAKAAGFHRRRNPKLGVLCDVGQEYAERLEAHLDAEERELFPALLAGGPLGVAVGRELDRMELHHRQLPLVLARVRWLADDFAVPSWADHGYQALMEELAALEQDLCEHVRLEGSVLVPRLAARCVAAA